MKIGQIRIRLLTTATLTVGLMALPTAALADENDAGSAPILAQSTASSAPGNATQPIEQKQRYALRLMTQIYDGVEDFSHTQMLGFGRIRKGNRSITQFDFGDGAVVIDGEDGLAASRFMNVSPTEKAVVYNYDTKRISGDSEIAYFHNRYVRPWLGKGPDLDSNVQWAAKLPISAFGLPGLTGDDVAVQFSREYFAHDGKPMVLVHYAVPAFAYDSNGKSVIHWARGISLTDPGFSTIYLNSTLHRAVVGRDGSAGRPVRYARTMVAANPDGSAMIDYRDVPQLQQYVDDFFSAKAMRVVPALDGSGIAEPNPIALARNMDILALSIGEDGANDVPITSAAQASTNRGEEILSTLGARGSTNSDDIVFSNSSSITNQTIAEEAVDMQQSGGRPGGSGGEGEFEVSPETLDLLRQNAQNGGDEVGDAFDRVRGGGGDTTFGNPDNADAQRRPITDVIPDNMTGSDGKIANSQYWLDKANAILGGGIARLNDIEKVEVIEQVAGDIVEQGSLLSFKANRLTAQLEQAQDALAKGGKQILELSPGNKLLQSKLLEAASDFGQAEGNFEKLTFQLAELAKDGKAIPEQLRTDVGLAETALRNARDYYNNMESAFETATKNGKMTVALDFADPDTKKLADRVSYLYRELGKTSDEFQALSNKTEGLASLLRGTPIEKISATLDRLGDSPAGKVLNGVSHGMNAYSTGKAVYNVYDAATSDKSSGKLDLSRNYSSPAKLVGGIALDVLALGGNALQGDFKGFYSDAIAITTGAISDIYVANKALNDTYIAVQVAHEEYMKTLKKQTAQIQRIEKEKYEKLMNTEYGLYTDEPANDGGVSDPNWQDPRLDPDTGLPKPDYWRYLKTTPSGRAKLASFGIDPDAPVGGWPGGIGPEHRPETTVENNDKPSVDDGGPGYPTAPKVIRVNDTEDDGEYDGPPPSILSDAQLAAIERERKRQEAQEALDEYQEKKLAEQKAEREQDQSYQKPGSENFRVTALETSELIVSEFDMDPVVFDPVVFDPVRFDEDNDLFDEDGNLKKVGPDDFEMTPFDPPEISKFPPTDPDDLDGYPGTGEYPSVGLDSISGSATEPDLSRWEEWLATQDIRTLEQLARAAGYPSLAFALADAENIIRRSKDSGYRAYANRGPNCAGYTGCTGSVGPWRLAYATIRLGDILAQSQDIFSTGGLSDVAISGFNLQYALRDFGIQDGDLIDVEITQFGRTVFNLRRHFLLTAGTPFSARLRKGVARLVVTALNEGSASPNTAEVTIQNVVRGDARQTYSLETGQTATLRVESGATQ